MPGNSSPICEMVHGMDAGQFALRLRELMSAAGLTQTELAVRAGVTQGAVSKWCRGTPPTVDYLDAIADALGVEPAELLKPPTTTPPPPRRGRPPGDGGGPRAREAPDDEPPPKPPGRGGRRRPR